MTKFRSAAAARFRTSNVAIPVVATPETVVPGSPALNVSTVSERQEIFWSASVFWMLVTMSCAVTPGTPIRIGEGGRCHGHARRKRLDPFRTRFHPRRLGHGAADRNQ